MLNSGRKKKVCGAEVRCNKPLTKTKEVVTATTTTAAPEAAAGKRARKKTHRNLKHNHRHTKNTDSIYLFKQVHCIALRNKQPQSAIQPADYILSHINTHKRKHNEHIHLFICCIDALKPISFSIALKHS